MTLTKGLYTFFVGVWIGGTVAVVVLTVIQAVKSIRRVLK